MKVFARWSSSPGTIQGLARVDSRTKNLVKRLRPGDIAVIDHSDLDEVAARSLIERRVSAVVNFKRSISGRYPNSGPGILLDSGIPVVDEVQMEQGEKITEGITLEIRKGEIWSAGRVIAKGYRLDKRVIEERMSEAWNQNLSGELRGFLNNTLEYVEREKEFFIKGFRPPAIKTALAGRHALVVARGRNFKQDLVSLRGYIAEMRPVLIGVDGGADALLEIGLRPDLVVGDMDSVSDDSLQSAREIIVDAYPGGRSPGLARILGLGLHAYVVEAPGTSEDLGMLLAYELGSEMIVAVGTHNSFVDFLEKGRQGMASTFLVRLKIGSKLVDARGVSLLYRRRLRGAYIVNLVAAALAPLVIASLLAPQVRFLISLWWIHLNMKMGL